jgi:hypothetical protein
VTEPITINCTVPTPVMIELTRTEDVVFASWLEMRLAEAGIKAYVLDAYTSGLYGGALGAIQRRVMVAEEDLPEARRLMREAGCETGERGDG